VIVSDGSDEEDSDSDEDEEGWLVEDDEAEDVSGEVVNESSESVAKRKFKATSDDKDAKRRKVEKLIPFQKGPCWETKIGQCTYDAFNAYRIQLLNGERLLF
jgi:chromatin assembly factor 1 subunit A